MKAILKEVIIVNDNFLNLSIDNINNEHLCCAISDKKHQSGVCTKKEWLKDKCNNCSYCRKENYIS